MSALPPPSSSSSSLSSSCPCKKLPWSLSSFTAAEYGDVHSLVVRKQAKCNINNNNRGSSNKNDNNKSKHDNDNKQNNAKNSLATSPMTLCHDSAGNTPLHYAAQHGHIAATAWLLQEQQQAQVCRRRRCDDIANSQHSPSTTTDVTTTTTTTTTNTASSPLHRASFSGAVGTMQLLLLDPIGKHDLMTIDGSFGDHRTPLHKAAAGGRQMAIQLLLDTLRSCSLLDAGLSATDAYGQTALDIAKEFVRLDPIQLEQERNMVRRWDHVAGGRADWIQCFQLLESARQSLHRMGAGSSSTSQTIAAAKSDYDSTPPLNPPTIPPSLQGSDMCLDCDSKNDGQCRIASWERSFQAVLSQNMQQHVLVQFDNTLTSIQPSRHDTPSAASATKPKGTTITGGGEDDDDDENNHSPMHGADASQEEEEEAGPPLPQSATTTTTTTTAIIDMQALLHVPPTNTATMGRPCACCFIICIVLYPRDGDFVCKACRRGRSRRETSNGTTLNHDMN